MPFIGNFPIGQLKSLSVCGLDAEAFFAGPAPARDDLCDLVANALPDQRKWTLCVFGIRAALDGIHHDSRISLLSPTFSWMTLPSPLPRTFAWIPTRERHSTASSISQSASRMVSSTLLLLILQFAPTEE